MAKVFTRIIVWIGLMAVMTLIAMGIWYAGWHGSQATESLKWLQLLQTLGIFLLPAIAGAWIWSDTHRPFEWLKMNRGADWQTFALAIGIMVCAMPAINLLADWNSRIELPESLGFIEQKMKEYEAAAALLTERFLVADNIGMLLVNIGLMALLPALAEEISFRGTLQQLLSEGDNSRTIRRTATAIWVTAFIFSAIHLQFYGFIPRMLMGAMFGYLFVWTGCLWVPVVMHFTNNGMAVVVYYITGEGGMAEKNWADTFGAGSTWWVGVLSLMITSLGLLIFYRRTHKQ